MIDKTRTFTDVANAVIELRGYTFTSSGNFICVSNGKYTYSISYEAWEDKIRKYGTVNLAQQIATHLPINF